MFCCSGAPEVLFSLQAVEQSHLLLTLANRSVCTEPKGIVSVVFDDMRLEVWIVTLLLKF